MSASNESTTTAELLLKVTASRVPKHLIARPRLMGFSAGSQGHPIVLVRAPGGFGKTSLLAQWRKEYMAHGVVVAWVRADPQDVPQRFVESLLLAVRQGSGRPGFGRSMRESNQTPLERTTLWLAEIARAALDMVLFIDEAEQLPAETAEVLVYVMRNAPSNLRIVVASRSELNIDVEDLIDYGECVVVGAPQLRFQLDETIALVANRLGSRIDANSAARLHDLVEGWPLGLQLVLATVSSSEEPGVELAALNAKSVLREQAVSMLLSNLGPQDVDFLANVSILDLVQPQLCQAVMCEAGAGDQLARLTYDTPIFTADERGGWLRMHQLLRDALGRRFASFPAERQMQAHARAANWLADHELLEAAARHALASGQTQWAFDLAERSLYRDLMERGRLGAVSDWLARLPEEEVDRRPRLLLAAAWALGTNGRHSESAKLVTRILAQSNVDASVRSECTLILASGMFYSDDPDRFVELSLSMGDDPPLFDPVLRQFFACQVSMRTLLACEPALARMQALKVVDSAGAESYPGRWAQCLVGTTYLREGQVTLAESHFRAMLSAAELELGRMGQFTCMVASLLATTLWHLNRVSEAGTVLANRLAVLEQNGSVETLVGAYRTVARSALANGAEHRAIEALEALNAVGLTREMPAVCIMSLVEQIRLHARRFRTETCRSLLDKLDEIWSSVAPNHGPIWQRSMQMQRLLAQAYTVIAAQEWSRALVPIAAGIALAQDSKNGKSQLEFMALKALCQDRCGENPSPLVLEIADLAQSFGLRRIFLDAHPLMVDLAVRAGAALDHPPVLSAPSKAAAEQAGRVRAVPSLMLTPREREVLEQLARNLSNKEIALAMQVGEQAIKWHVKNLFAKLDAGTRKQVVQRARILGLLEE